MTTKTNTGDRITTPRLNFLIALFPGFQLLDVAGPLDIFNFLSSPPYSAPIKMKFVAESVEPVGTKLVDLPSSAGGGNGEREEAKWDYDVQTATGLAEGEQVNGGWNQKLMVDVTFDEVLQGLNITSQSQRSGKKEDGEREQYDVLFIPGGVGSRVRRRRRRRGKDSRESELAVQPLVDFIKAIKPHLRLGIITVCTGSDILAYTGLLDGRRATTNMSRFADVASRHKGVNWQKGARWVRSPIEEDRDRNGDGETGRKEKAAAAIEIWTSAGVSAGIDVALAFVADNFGGVEVARGVAKKSEYDWSEPKDGEICPFYKQYFDV